MTGQTTFLLVGGARDGQRVTLGGAVPQLLLFPYGEQYHLEMLLDQEGRIHYLYYCGDNLVRDLLAGYRQLD